MSQRNADAKKKADRIAIFAHSPQTMAISSGNYCVQFEYLVYCQLANGDKSRIYAAMLIKE